MTWTRRSLWPTLDGNCLVKEKFVEKTKFLIMFKRREISFFEIIWLICCWLFSNFFFFRQLRRTMGMAQLPRWMGQLEKRMRSGTPQRWMSTKPRTHFPWWTWRHASAEDPAVSSSVNYCANPGVSSATTSPRLCANLTATCAHSGASGTRFRLTQLSLQKAGSWIGFALGSGQYGRTGHQFGWRYWHDRASQYNWSPSHIRSGRLCCLNDYRHDDNMIFPSGSKKGERNGDDVHIIRTEERAYLGSTLQ